MKGIMGYFANILCMCGGEGEREEDRGKEVYIYFE